MLIVKPRALSSACVSATGALAIVSVLATLASHDALRFTAEFSEDLPSIAAIPEKAMAGIPTMLAIRGSFDVLLVARDATEAPTAGINL